ncbi:MAG TPA: hypothetical protein VJU83_04045, partial [Burkholderiales bacterium]|nr:hypothetical protein [Burkholderiales bacterium]
MQLPKRAFDPSEESFFETYILSCPWCDEALFHLETVPDTPFVTKRAGDPIIQSKGSDFFCV